MTANPAVMRLVIAALALLFAVAVMWPWIVRLWWRLNRRPVRTRGCWIYGYAMTWPSSSPQRLMRLDGFLTERDGRHLYGFVVRGPLASPGLPHDRVSAEYSRRPPFAGVQVERDAHGLWICGRLAAETTSRWYAIEVDVRYDAIDARWHLVGIVATPR